MFLWLYEFAESRDFCVADGSFDLTFSSSSSFCERKYPHPHPPRPHAPPLAQSSVCVQTTISIRKVILNAWAEPTQELQHLCFCFTSGLRRQTYLFAPPTPARATPMPHPPSAVDGPTPLKEPGSSSCRKFQRKPERTLRESWPTRHEPRLSSRHFCFPAPLFT